MKAIYKKDAIVCAAVFIVAIALRLPYIGYPSQPVLDEGYFATFEKNTVDGLPFFEGHPPLGWYIPSLFVNQSEAETWQKDMAYLGTAFRSFPYVRLRMINAILGSLLAVMIFLIARALGIKRQTAFFPAIFIAFDNALISFSRIMLPQTLLLFFGALGFLLFIISERRRDKPSGASSSVGSASLALSTAVKLTGLGFAAPAFLLLLLNRSFKKIIVSIAIMIVAYAAVFVVYSHSFKPGPADPVLGYFQPPGMQALQFPDFLSLNGQAKFFVDYNRDIFKFQDDYGTLLRSFAGTSGGPYDAFNPGSIYQWPFSGNPFPMWASSSKRQSITLCGNYFVWITALIAVLYAILKLVYRLYEDRKDWLVKNKAALVLLIGYLANYVPFFFIPRPMYLYNYLAALIFGLLLAGDLLLDIEKTVKPRLYYIFLATVIIGMASFFLVGLKTTYGL